MPRYSGITSSLARTRKEHMAYKKNVRDWTHQQFRSREAAQRRENAQRGEHEPGRAPATAPWWGYSFIYDRW